VKISNEIKIGLMAIVAIALLIFGYNYLKGKNLLEDSRTFYSVYDQVEGLNASSAVTINGLQVGSVSKIDIREDAKLVVTMNIKNDYPFSKSSVAEIYGGDLIGGKSVAIVPNFKDKTMAEPGDTLKGKIEVGLLELVNDQLSPLQKKIEDGVSSVDTLLNSINYIMDEKTNNSLKNSILKFNNTIDQLSSTSEEINKLIKTNSDEFTNTMNNLSEMSGKFNSISDSLSKIEFNKIVKDLETSLAQVKSITSKIDRGEGSLGKLINDENMYTNLENATKQMEELLQDMKLNPKRYVHFSVFGKKNREYQEAEDNEE
jgi:phospholipid/cholesterol/gamma-HCH transport system substrate-binding protein